MFKTSLTISLLILFFCNVKSVSAQYSEISRLNDEDYLQMELPPLAVLFENARGSAAVEFYNTQKEVQQSMLKTQKREWLKYIKATGGYQYGMMGINATFSDPYTPIFNQFSSSKQSWYNVGLVVSVPFDDLFDRGNKINRQKLAVKATEAETEKWYDEQKMRIIESYSNALQFMSVIKAKSESMVLANAQYKIAENDFINGKINAADLSARKSVQTDAIADYEQTKAALNMALLQLEVLSRTKIINK